MTALPPTYYLHVWWARRPLVASRAAVLGSLLPADADRERFMHVLGIHGDPIAAKKRIAEADRKGERLGASAYGYPRAFSAAVTDSDREWIRSSAPHPNVRVVDPTAGGGSIPFESLRLGLATHANDLNPVAALILRATVEWPARFAVTVLDEFKELGGNLRRTVVSRLKDNYPLEPEHDCKPDGYLWARTITCPYCGGVLPLSPNWRLAPDGTGVRIHPHTMSRNGGRVCTFEIVTKAADQSVGTVSDGDATCPFPDCARVIDGAEVKRQAQRHQMGDQLFAVVYKRKIISKTKTGKPRIKWVRGYRAARLEDDKTEDNQRLLEERMAQWEAADLVPTEAIGEISNYDRGHRLYGMTHWRDLFAPRQLLAHVTAVEVYNELLAEAERKGTLSETTKAAFGYLGLSLDKMLDYNSRISAWHGGREVLEHTFRDHAFVLKWSYAEMAVMVDGVGYDWAIKQTAKCIEEFIELVRPDIDLDAQRVGGHQVDAFAHGSSRFVPPPVTVTCKSADALDHIADGTVDAVVMDPPYGANVMYAELSDFFYVWLKRTAGRVFPELFRRALTDKEREAVANVAKFAGQLGAKNLATRDYRERMSAVFTECRRILRSDGILTLMFTHKETGAWDALTKGLMEAGFTITASWPVNTEAETSMHIKEKSAANSTIFLVCRPRQERAADAAQYWEDVEPWVARAVRARVDEFKKAGITGVDLYLASFGPALQEFSRHWPLKRGQPQAEPKAKRRKQADIFDEPWDPYAVTPEDALNAARREVKRWRLDQLTHMKARAELDPLTSFFVLAWDAFHAPVFPYDEALRLARAVGVDLDKEVVGRLAGKKGSDLQMWDSAQRVAKGAIGPPDGSRAMIDAVHHASYIARTRTVEAARELLERAHVDREPAFFAALEAVLEVLPVPKSFSGIDLTGAVQEAASDFEALERLRRLAFKDDVDKPEQLALFEVAEGSAA